MYTFDPAINYGPNDAGVSALSIALVVIAVLASFWLLGAAYELIENFIKTRKDQGDDWCSLFHYVFAFDLIGINSLLKCTYAFN